MQNQEKTGAAPAEMFELEIADKKIELDLEQLKSAAVLGIIACGMNRPEDDDGDDAIAALEERVSALEKNEENRKKSTGGARGHAADDEMAQLEAVYDAVFNR